jgi:HK97 family phage major capsid protein
MRLVDKLRQAKAACLDKMANLNEATERENRVFGEAEVVAWDILKAECVTLDSQISNAEERATLLRSDTTAAPINGGPRLIAEDGTVLRALRNTDKLTDLLPRGVTREQIPIGTVLRGIVHGQWKGMKPLERAVGVTGDSVFPVPEAISNDWLDMARAASVAFKAGAITIPMRTFKERIVAVTQDPVFTFRKEHKPIPESDILLGPIDLQARLCGAIVRTSVELLEDSPLANELIQSVLIAKMSSELDYALLAADGSQVGDLDRPTGLLFWPTVPGIIGSNPVLNYDAFVDAYASVLGNNGVPTAMIAGTGMAAASMKIKTGIAGDNTILAPPGPIADLPKYFSTTLGANAVVGDFSMLAWGLRTGATLEVTRVGGEGTFSQAQVLIRLYFRGDTAVLRPKWFAKVTGLPTTLVAAEDGGVAGQGVPLERAIAGRA